MKKTLFLSLILLVGTQLSAQRKLESSADILQEMHKLKVLGNVLYLAAHPDDENTRLIAWLENEKMVRTAYLSLTRGDGGQNLIGTEKGDALGVLRTQELLEARNEDGGEQFFTRAKDFGYSKNPEETFEKWNKEKVLEDVVWVIRKFQPDVIVTRFPSDGRGGHGHHTASAMLAEEAFDLSADPNYAPDQLKQVDTWQVKRLLWNTSVWWDRQLPEKAAKAEDYIKIDIGDYNSRMGLSYSEIASDARSQHKSQGFGSARARGTNLEYLKHTKGDQAKDDLFQDIDLSWKRLENGEKVETKIKSLIAAYDMNDPSKSVPALTELHQMILDMESNVLRDQKLNEVERLILSCSGTYLEALATDYLVSKDRLKINAKVVVRSDVPIKLKSINGLDTEITIDSMLPENVLKSYELTIPEKYFSSVGHPYWLNDSYDEAIFFDPMMRGAPKNKDLYLSYHMEINGKAMVFHQMLDYKWVDRAKGELHRDVISAPEFTLSAKEESFLFTSQEAQKVSMIIEAFRSNLKGEIEIELPDGWTSTPSKLSYDLQEKGEQKSLEFELTPPKKSSSGMIKFKQNGEAIRSIQRIDYDHIRPQILFSKSEINITKFDLAEPAQRIAYIEGSGDLVDENLRQVGYTVDHFTANDILTADLSSYQSIIVGIRAYNVEENMKSVNQVLNDFAKNGGTVIVQYNTSRGLKSDEIGPYPIQLSRNRVTDEYAKATLLDEKHPVFQQPNQLTEADFENWVQERGLYFVGVWGEEYQALISWNDKGESPQKGALIVADYGEGKFIYTGISFFRQLPAGVPGAYRLFANLIAYGQ